MLGNVGIAAALATRRHVVANEKQQNNQPEPTAMKSADVLERTLTDATIGRDGAAWAIVEPCEEGVRAYVPIGSRDDDHPPHGSINGYDCVTWQAPDLASLEATGQALIDAARQSRSLLGGE
jgi:hypothetical protein